MYMISILDTGNSKSRINANSMVDNTSFSIAKECKPLYEDEIRINGVNSHSKSKKREGNIKEKIEFITYKIRMMLR